jgi:hypothetical protein
MTNCLLGVFGAVLNWVFEEADKVHHSVSRLFGGKFELLDVVETHHRAVTNAAPRIRVLK